MFKIRIISMGLAFISIYPHYFMTILFFGDIMGKIGRKAVEKIFPSWKKKYKPDFVIANGENLAHGIGVTEKTVQEIFDAGVDFLTGGNHSLRREDDLKVWDESKFGLKMIRPFNTDGPGKGFRIVDVKGHKLVIASLMGRVFFKEEYEDPFKAIDEILSASAGAFEGKPPTVILDFHAEATSEKNALGWYLDGRISALVGTHTHVPTCDAKILPGGTAYITDVGMVGLNNSVLGIDKDVIIESFLEDKGFKHIIAEKGEAIVSAVLIKINEKTGQAKSIKKLEEIVRV